MTFSLKYPTHPLLPRSIMLLTALCTTTLGLSACDEDTLVGNQASDMVIAANYNSTFKAPDLPDSRYLIGTGIADITGAAAETGMFGYAAGQVVEGINDRLYSHAFIIGEDNTAYTNNTPLLLDETSTRVVYVSADMGAMFTAVKQAVIKQLQANYGTLYNDDNVMLAATHTHVGNAGYSHQKLYQIASFDDTTAGYSSQNFNAIVNGIVRSIERAHDSLTPGTLSLAQGSLSGATLNRSLPAYNLNEDANDYDSTVNETMTQLRFNAIDGTPLGLINWFAVHPTSFSNQFMHLSADNKGYAQQQAQKYFDSKPNDDIPFVAAFANADSGDVIVSGGNANSAPGYEGEDNEHANVIRDGQLQFEKSAELWDKGAPVVGPIDVRARWVDLEGYIVDSSYTNGAGVQQLCQPARGYSFAAGGENGPSDIPGMYEGMTRGSFRLNDSVNQMDASVLGTITRGVFSIISTVNQDNCQAEKQVLLPTGGWRMINTEQPVQLMRIGNIALVAIPNEPTTMVGRRLRAAVYEVLKDSGVDTVIINGLANNYSGYLATREEFAAQHYEGASTEFGPYQMAAYMQEYTQLAQAMRDGTTVYDAALPPNTSGATFHERPGVIYDDKPLSQEWGEVITQPKAWYQRGQTATAVYRGAHPKNNLRTEDTFLKVQRLQDGVWTDYLSDADFDTTYSWKRSGVASSTVTVDWRIAADTPVGTYRLLHQGDWKNGWTYSIQPYEGISNTFMVE